MKKLHRTLAGILLAGAVLVAACGKGSGTDTTKVTAPAQGTSDPCRLVTSAEVEKAIGAPVGPPGLRTSRLGAGWTLKQCGHFNPGGDGGVTVGIYSKRGGGITSAEFNRGVRNGPNSSGIERVDGVGDEALMKRLGLTVALTFRKGSKMAVVGMRIVPLRPTNSSEVENSQRHLRERLLEVSRLAAGRL